MILTTFNSKLHDRLPGWQFEPSDARGGCVYRKFEGYYPDKGGRLISPLIMRQAAAGYYAVGFDARALERGYQGVEFFDAGGKLLADCYDVVYPGPKRRYARMVYAMPTVAGMRVFFQARSKLEAWNRPVESVAPVMAAEYCDRVYAAMPPKRILGARR